MNLYAHVGKCVKPVVSQVTVCGFETRRGFHLWGCGVSWCAHESEKLRVVVQLDLVPPIYGELAELGLTRFPAKEVGRKVSEVRILYSPHFALMIFAIIFKYFLAFLPLKYLRLEVSMVQNSIFLSKQAWNFLWSLFCICESFSFPNIGS